MDGGFIFISETNPVSIACSPTQFVSFWHAALGYPTKSSLIRHIRNGNIMIDGLTLEVVRKHFVPSIFTALGHLDATRANVKSTKERLKPAKNEITVSSILVTTYTTTGRVHADQTGAQPVLGRLKENLISIFFDEATNYIHAQTLVNDSAKSLLAATHKAITLFAKHGSSTVTFRIDNQISNKVRDYLTKNDIQLELTPVGQHRRNKAERSIRSFKNHFIASVAGVDKDCLMELWPDF